jgi:hypothetical protein
MFTIPVCDSTLINPDRIPRMNILRHRETLSLKVYVSVDIEFFLLYIYTKKSFTLLPDSQKLPNKKVVLVNIVPDTTKNGKSLVLTLY